MALAPGGKGFRYYYGHRGMGRQNLDNLQIEDVPILKKEN